MTLGNLVNKLTLGIFCKPIVVNTRPPRQLRANTISFKEERRPRSEYATQLEWFGPDIVVKKVEK